MLIRKLIKDNPKFHSSPDGSLKSWAVHPDVLSFIYSTLNPNMTTLETGAGQTTVVFAIAGTKHTCITPSKDQVLRIKQYCSELGVGDHLNFLVQSSDLILPCDELIPSELDFVLIDGAHRFPFPCIDWHYTEGKLVLGGIIGLDDYKMPSVRVLFDFMNVEEEWELIAVIYDTAFFKKIREPVEPYYWKSQKFNSIDKSWRSPFGSLIAKLKARLVRLF